MRYLDPEQIAADKLEASKWAYDLLKGDFIVLDLETTGFGKAEAVEVALINKVGRVLLSTLVKPTIPIPPRVTELHGITDAMVEDAPSFPEISPALNRWTDKAQVIIYNSPFDTGILAHCSSFHGLPMVTPSYIHCAMRQYAKFMGQWDGSKGSYKWHKLTGGDHTALGDCKATLKLIREMAEGYRVAIEVRAEEEADWGERVSLGIPLADRIK